jgi:multidrug efflux pump subunit AcrA (membrane-fusion protein)
MTMFVRKYVIPVAAVVGVLLAVKVVVSSAKPVIAAPPVAEPAKSPYTSQIAGAGLIEASTRNIAIGTNVGGVAMKVFVEAGDSVKAGDPLFTIDDRAYRAELAVREAALASAEKTLEKLRASPRPEEVPPLEAKYAESASQLADARDQLTRMESVEDRRAVTDEDLKRRRFAVLTAESRVAEAKAQLDLLKAGSWSADVAIAEAQVQSARAQVESIKTDIDRLTVRAPVTGQVLQLNVRQGEYAQAGALATPLVLVGDTETLHVRVDIDENDAWRFLPSAKATASLRGNSGLRTGLTFVRAEPYVIPKRSLTGDSSERVDTRVLQVLYSFKRSELPVYVGQQMDVFIEAPSAGGGGTASERGVPPRS